MLTFDFFLRLARLLLSIVIRQLQLLILTLKNLVLLSNVLRVRLLPLDVRSVTFVDLRELGCKLLVFTFSLLQFFGKLFNFFSILHWLGRNIFKFLFKSTDLREQGLPDFFQLKSVFFLVGLQLSQKIVFGLIRFLLSFSKLLLEIFNFFVVGIFCLILCFSGTFPKLFKIILNLGSISIGLVKLRLQRFGVVCSLRTL